MYILYTLTLAFATLLSLPWWALQMLRHGKYRAGLSERLGLVPQRIKETARPGCVWIHAVSVGEVLAISTLFRELEAAFPRVPVFLSTTTLTGQQLARERFSSERVFYLPLDFGFCLRPYLRLLRPQLLILAETEFWPNLLHLSKAQGAAVAIVNARISDRSFPRYRLFRRLFGPVLADVDLFLAQTEEDRRRLVEIGASAENAQVSGNLKFDIRLSANSPLVADLRRGLPQDKGSPVIVCGSTTEGEEALLLAAFQQVLREHPSAVMVLAPRHPERFGAVANLIAGSGLSYVKRSTWKKDCRLAGGVFLLDSVGELAAVYALATVAFVGGSLVPVGGHNILEPAQHAVAVMTGPHTANFREIVRIFEQGGALRVVTAETLAAELLQLLRDQQQREALGQRAQALFREHTGATQRMMEALRPLITRAAGAP
ncbi:MAG TPA: 3-deoxy-D-manno-octulosonic acid transferase [Candidatus Angelobacter sp.]|nr:3-deoxy-D-manno-octulosonic acid transferase [Candidatus Angelobacter sp.]